MLTVVGISTLFKVRGLVTFNCKKSLLKHGFSGLELTMTLAHSSKVCSYTDNHNVNFFNLHMLNDRSEVGTVPLLLDYMEKL